MRIATRMEMSLPINSFCEQPSTEVSEYSMQAFSQHFVQLSNDGPGILTGLVSRRVLYVISLRETFR